MPDESPSLATSASPIDKARGKYIVIEGNDGTGKSTQAELLADYFRAQNEKALVVEEPGSSDLSKSTPVANYLRSLIKNGNLARSGEINLALFSAARRELWQQKIAPALEQGITVISARNYLSTLVYQGYGEGLSLDYIRDTTALFTSERYLHPDHTIILTINDETERNKRIAKRGQLTAPDTFESRSTSFQRQLNKGYSVLARDLCLPMIDCIATDGWRKTAEEIAAEIQAIII